MLYDANKEKYEEELLFGHPVLFTPERIDRSTLPDGLYKYELRHDDECQGVICELASSIIVNFWGTIITNKEIQVPEHGLIIDEGKDFGYSHKNSRTIAEYQKNYPLNKKEDKER